MEMNHRPQIQNENYELTYQLKVEKAINADQAEELKRQKEINQTLEKNNSARYCSYVIDISFKLIFKNKV
mgnify:CR=1 FL=1